MTSDRIPQERVESILKRAIELDLEWQDTVSVERLRTIALEAGVSEAAFAKALAEASLNETSNVSARADSERSAAAPQNLWQSFKTAARFVPTWAQLTVAGVAGFLLPATMFGEEAVARALMILIGMMLSLNIGLHDTPAGLRRGFAALVAFYFSAGCGVAFASGGSVPAQVWLLSALVLPTAIGSVGISIHLLRRFARFLMRETPLFSRGGGGTSSGGGGGSSDGLSAATLSTPAKKDQSDNSALLPFSGWKLRPEHS